MEVIEGINKFLPLISALSVFIFSYLVYRLKDMFKKEFAEMRTGLETDIKDYIDKKFLEHTNEDLREANRRKQKYIDELESRIDKK